ncbi:MAG: hypothetical protein KJZ92_16795 [Rhodocyclaceae bacterium]|nr:hypothetical protein [Rhodocyclaceae bacterium]
MKLVFLAVLGVLLTGCAAMETRYAASQDEMVILVSKADRPGYSVSHNAAGLPSAVGGLVGNVGRAGAIALDAGTAAAINHAGRNTPTLEVRAINSQTCQRVVYHANLADERVMRMTAGDMGRWQAITEGEKLALAPIPGEDGATRKIRRSHPCFEAWMKDYEKAWNCHSCMAPIHISMSKKTRPTLEWLKD